MPNRVVIFLAASGLAAVVLVLALLAGSPTSAPPQVVAPPGDDADWGEPLPDGQGDAATIRTDGITFTHVRRDGQVYRFFSRTLEPLPGEVSQVTDPVIRVFFPETSRVLEIRSRSGRLVAPGQQPRRGDLMGGVVVTLYDGPGDRAVQYGAESSDVQLRMFVDQAHFDMDLGLLETQPDTPVRLTSPQFDFEGEGLKLSFNELDRRIDRLEIQRGHALRIRSEASEPGGHAGLGGLSGGGTGGSPDADSTEQDDQPGSGQLYRAVLEQNVTVRSPDVDLDGDRIVVWFRLESGADDAGEPEAGESDAGAAGRDRRGPGDRVVERRGVAFGMKAGGTDHRPLASSRITHAADAWPAAWRTTWPAPVRAGSLEPRLLAALPGAAGRTSPTATERTPDAEASATPSDAALEPAPPNVDDDWSPRSLTPPRDDDVVVAWTGPLVMTPADVAPQPMTLRGEVFLELQGSPASAMTQTGELLRGASLGYLVAADRLIVEGAASQPVRVEAPNLGRIEALRLMVDQRTGRGVIEGPGRLWSRNGSDPIPALTDAASSGLSSGPESAPTVSDPGLDEETLGVTWHERLDLYFFTGDPVDGEPQSEGAGAADLPGLGREGEGQVRLRALRAAVFRGQVRVTHSQFDLSSRHLAIELADPAAPRDQAFEAIVAEGEVEVYAGDADQSLAILADVLTIELRRDARDRLQPHRMLASSLDLVEARMDDQVLRSRTLDVRLGRPWERDAIVSVRSGDFAFAGTDMARRTVGASGMPERRSSSWNWRALTHWWAGPWPVAHVDPAARAMMTFRAPPVAARTEAVDGPVFPSDGLVADWAADASPSFPPAPLSSDARRDWAAGQAGSAKPARGKDGVASPQELEGLVTTPAPGPAATPVDPLATLWVYWNAPAPLPGLGASTITLREGHARWAGARGDPRPTSETGRLDLDAMPTRQSPSENEADIGTAFGLPADAPRRGIDIVAVAAAGDVHIELSDPVLEVFAQRMAVDAQLQQVELFGSSEAPIRMISDDGTLLGRHLILNQLTDTIRVIGEGTAVYVSDQLLSPGEVNAIHAEAVGAPAMGRHEARPESEAADAAPDADGDAPTVVTLQWREGLTLDQRVGLLHVFGHVVSRARSGDTLSRLTGDDMTVSFSRLPRRDVQSADAVDAEAGADRRPLSDGIHRGNGAADRFQRRTHVLHWVTVRGRDATFVGGAWPEPSAAQPELRLTLAGPQMTFDYLTEQLQVVGAGRMLVEDYRNPEQASRTDDAGDTGVPADASSASPLAVAFSGHGVTLFRWQGALTLDARENDMRLEDAAQTLHVASPSGRTVQLDADRLTADLEDIGGLNAWLSPDAPEPELLRIIAESDVRLLTAEFEAATDRLTYDARRELVLLTSERDGGSIVADRRAQTAPPLTARAFEWDLKSGVMRVSQLGRIMAPLRQAE